LPTVAMNETTIRRDRRTSTEHYNAVASATINCHPRICTHLLGRTAVACPRRR